MHPVLPVVLAFGLSCSFVARAADANQPDAALVGRVFPADSRTSTPAFTQERSRSTARETSVLTERFLDADGRTAALLESTYASGTLQSIAFAQLQTRESATAAFKDGRVFFTQSGSGETRTSEQVVQGKWVALSAVPDEIAEHWDDLVGGKSLRFAIPVPIMRDHFGFAVSRQRSWTVDGRRLTEFRMQPSSLVIRMMADAFYYVFDDATRALVEYRGVTIAKTLEDGKLKDLKARIVYAQPAGR